MVLAALMISASTSLHAQPKTEQSTTRDRLVRFPSAALGETRIVHINLPPNYRFAKRRYPVVVLLDGQVRPFFEMAVAATGSRPEKPIFSRSASATIFRLAGVAGSDYGDGLVLQ